MDVFSETIDNVRVIKIDGEINGQTAPELQETILAEARQYKKVVLDMADVAYMSSAGLRMMLVLYRQITQNDAQIRLASVSEEIQDTMGMTGFLEFFEIGPDVSSGVADLQAA